jgi:hypothetical protein
VVPVLLLGVLDRSRSQLEVIDVEAGCRTRDPRRAVDHLLPQVEQQPQVVLERDGAVVEALQHGHLGQVVLELEPDVAEALEERAAGVGRPGVRRRVGRGGGCHDDAPCG